MPSDYSPTPNRPATITVVTGDDLITDASVSTPLEELADWCAQIDEDADVTEDAVSALADIVVGYGTSKGVAYPIPAAAVQNLNSRWSISSTLWTQTDITDVGSVSFVFQLPPVGRLTAVIPLVDADAHGALPATMPTASLIRRDITAVLATIISTVSDPSPDTTTFEAPHGVPISGLTEDLSSTRTYQLTFTGEAGANAATGYKLLGVQFVIEEAP